MDGGSLATIRNHHVREFAYRFRDLVEHEYRISMVYLTTERATPRIESAMKRWNQTALRLGRTDYVDHRAEIVDVGVLLSTFDDEDVSAEIKFEDHFTTESTAKTPLSIHGNIAGSELVSLFRKHGFAMFRENPRGPLGPGVKINSQIIETLQSDDDRHRFHILNNGLTAVCEKMYWDEKTGTASVESFQIVNGCQTTYSIYAHSRDDGDMDGVLVPMKLVESKASSDLRSQISRTSNSQSKMTDWDFLSNVPLQRELQKQFEFIDPPMFYQLKRGEQRFMVSGQKQKMVHTTVKDVAQSVHAFLGEPGEAKDKPRDVATSYPTGTYQKVFWDGVTATQLALPSEIYVRVNQRWRARDKEDESAQRLSEARLHMVWLIGRLLMRCLSHDDTVYPQVPLDRIRSVSQNIDAWFPAAYQMAQDAVEDTMDLFDDQLSSGALSLRQLFRSDKYYDRFETRLNRVARRGFENLKEIILER